MNIAVIDIGSNTINLLVASVNDREWRKVVESKNPARLAKGGIAKNLLSDEAMERGIQALTSHLEVANNHQCEKIYAFATAAVRDASNKDIFLERVRTEVGIKIEIIDGLREAQLIAYGIKASNALSENCNLVLDIGGGSTEFILIKKNEIIYKQSFRLGVTKLLEKFKPQDPLSHKDIDTINEYINDSIAELKTVITKYKPTRLVGASGSFDSLAEMNAAFADTKLNKVKNIIPIENYHYLANKILNSNHDQRSKISGLVPHRVETILMAVILINQILDHDCIHEISQSSYALKEGVFELITSGELTI